MKYQILLFYKYTTKENPEVKKKKKKDLCNELGIKCRTIIAEEGINGTLEGTVDATEEYINIMSENPKFKDIHWKRSQGDGKAFPRVSVKVRDEIVSLSLGDFDFDPNDITGEYITAEELHDMYENNEEFYVIDMRNDYEMKVGHFRDAVLMPMSNFRELPEKLSEIEHLKDKVCVTTCTGGIRCEKASGFLKRNGFTNVYQLWGGMHTYIEKYPNKHFLGSLYVFDGRVTWDQGRKNTENHEVVGKCEKCGEASELYVDCGYLHCAGRRHFIICEKCLDKNGYAFCSDQCKEKAYSEKKFTKKRYMKVGD